MKHKADIKAENTWLYTLTAAFVAALGIRTFGNSFPEWNVALYFLSLLIMAISCAMLALIILKNRQNRRATLFAVISGGVFLAAAFGIIYLINNVMFGGEQAKRTAGIMSAVFGAVFLVICVFALFSQRSRAYVKAVCAVLCAVFIAGGSLNAVNYLLPVRYDHPFVEKITETKGLENVSEKNKLIINADDSHWWGFWNTLADNGAFDEDSMNAYVMQYADSGVADLLFNIFGQSSDTPTDVLTFRGSLYGQTLQNGESVDYSNYRGLSEIYNVQKKDIFAVWINKCREVGIRPWISLRMNDCHDPDETTSQLRGEIFYTAEENGWTIGEEYGYYRHCLNYAVPEIRQLMLDYTREQLLRYDVYGLELDFMREIYCFDYKNADTDEIVGIMNDYMRKTASIVKEAEEKWGHGIKLAVRLMRDIDQCLVYGFDPLTWCEEGLVDAITVTPRFSSNDSAMPIADWKQRCENVEIWAGVETLVNTQKKGCCASAEVVRGYAAQYLTAGADGLYLFNYMSSGTVGDREREVYDTCGSLDEILKYPRRHVVTYQDTCPEGWEPFKPLPLKVKAGDSAEIKIETGYIPENSEVHIYLGFDSDYQDLSPVAVSVNGISIAEGVAAEVYGRSEVNGSDVLNGYCDGDPHVYEFDLSDTKDLPNLLTVSIKNSSGKTFNIIYAEVSVTVNN